MYRINKHIVMRTAPSLTAFAGNIRSTLLSGNNNTNGYVITDKLNQRVVGTTVMLDMDTPIANPNNNNIKGVAFKVLSASRIWYEDDNGVIKEGGRYELERDDVSTALHILSDTSPSNTQPLEIILTQAPTAFLRKYPNSYTASKLALGGQMLEHARFNGRTIKLLITDDYSAEARILDSSDIIGAGTNTTNLFKRIDEIANGDIKASNVRIRIGFSKDEVDSVIKTFRRASAYKTFGDRVMYETGKVFFSIGSNNLTFDTCEGSGFVGDAGWLGTGPIGDGEEVNVVDEAGFVRRLVYNGNLYNFPVVDIAPVATGYEDELFKIKQLSNLKQGDIAASLVSLITEIVGSIPSPVTGSIAAAMRSIDLVPPEYKSSFSYAMFQMSGLKELGNSVLTMKSKERDGSTLYNDVRPIFGYYYASDKSVQPVQQLMTSDYSNVQNSIVLPEIAYKAGNTLNEMYEAMRLGNTPDRANHIEFKGYIRHYLYNNVDFPISLYDPLNNFLQSGFAFVNDSHYK